MQTQYLGGQGCFSSLVYSYDLSSTWVLFLTFHYISEIFLQSSSCEKIEEDEVCWCLEFPLSLSLSNVECEPQKVFGTEAEAHNYLNIFSLMNNTKYCLLDWVLCVCVCICV